MHSPGLDKDTECSVRLRKGSFNALAGCLGQTTNSADVIATCRQADYCSESLARTTPERAWARLSFQNLERMAPMATSLSGSTSSPTRPVKELVTATMRPKFFTPNSAFTICTASWQALDQSASKLLHYLCAARCAGEDNEAKPTVSGDRQTAACTVWQQAPFKSAGSLARSGEQLNLQSAAPRKNHRGKRLIDNVFEFAMSEEAHRIEGRVQQHAAAAPADDRHNLQRQVGHSLHMACAEAWCLLHVRCV